MEEKLKQNCITETVLVGGTYRAEQRQQPERRQIGQRRLRYERRQARDRRLAIVKPIHELV